ncbi:Nuclear actin-protein involved in chromatin remodeling [Kickxella alabastrina]|uniref:Nuclear actin-protein involved in chromatin remodeling n=1 Tax=Kickxella alabastrina TaxID=61397 RepID=A0ACC1IWD2_9FUNG|nr:Nuclear actin-protein involved in chromatin remodeling [Kickxella alabastrina]
MAGTHTTTARSRSRSTYDIPDGPADPTPGMASFDFASMGQGGTVPLVIDNGSGTCRAGWATENDPRLEFDNIVAKYRNRKLHNDPLLLVGSNVYSDPMAKSNIRSGFDNGIITNFEVMEGVLDYVFTMLGCTQDTIGQPIVMTEAACTPYASRRHMSELLFECYNVPSVTYGIDAAWSYYKNTGSFSTDGLVVSSGRSASHVIPIYDARVATEQCRRINLGGVAMEEYLLKLLQLKYPSFPMKITEWQSRQLVNEFAYVAQDYEDELSSCLTAAGLEASDVTVQLPFPAPSLDERTEEDIQRAAERRRDQARKMQEMAAKRRQEKADLRVQQLEQLTEIRAAKPHMDEAAFAERMRSAGFASEQSLGDAIASAQQQLGNGGGAEPEEREPPAFPLVDVPDEQLAAEQRLEKRKQVFLKGSHDARERARAEKERERAKQEEAARLDDERRQSNFGQWLADLQARRSAVITRMDDRRARRRELSDRRSHASQVRMRNIADLAAHDAPGAAAGGKRRRRGDNDDTFGAEDDDWNVYRDITKEEEAEEDDEDEAELERLTRRLEQFAPDYLESLDRAARAKIEATAMYRFAEGCQSAILDKPAVPYKPDNEAIVARAAREYQLHLNVERMRVPEIIFRPSLVGFDQAGLIEAIDSVVRNTGRPSLVSNIFVTGGGFACVEGILQRLQRDVVGIMPERTLINVCRAADPLRDAWRGAALWSMAEPEAFRASCVTRQDYLEKGGEYIREHEASNRYHAFPAAATQ